MPLLSTFGAASARSFGGIGAVAAGAGLDINEAFSTYLYEGTGSTNNINNGIDLSGEGGLVWTKVRDATYDHWLFDTARGAEKELNTNNTIAQGSTLGALQQFNSNGYQLGYSGGAYAELNQSGKDYVSWTFRKAPKFFDVVTWSGNSTAGRTISHSLNSSVGMLIVKNLTTSGSGYSHWRVWHRSENTKTGTLETTNAFSTTDAYSKFGNGSSLIEPTSTEFTVGADYDVNRTGESYVGYLFANNNNDGGFGPDADQDVIKCGKYTGTGSSGNSITLGFEPQWLLIRNASSSGAWIILDNMRGLPVGGNVQELFPHLGNAENTSGNTRIDLTPTGFTHTSSATNYNTNGDTYIYMAIRRGPLAAPENATDVFQPVVSNVPNPNMVSTNLSYIDMAISKKEAGGQSYVQTRLTGDAFLKANGGDAETTGTSLIEFDHNSKMRAYFDTYGSDHINYFWKRAPEYFDVVTWDGNNSNRTIAHNLGVAPEMMWYKVRSYADSWAVYHKDLTSAAYALRLDATNAEFSAPVYFNSTAPTSSVISVGTDGSVNLSGHSYIAYLFASVAGVSKVGSYTGNGSSQTIDCGFSSGARFVLIKRTDSSQHWILFDSTRGIVSGNDPSLKLSDTEAEYSGGDDIDPTNSGFIINNDTANGYQLSTSGASYIFYAIA